MGFAFPLADADRVEAALRTAALAAETAQHAGTARFMGYMNYAFTAIQGRPLVYEPTASHAHQHYLGSPLVERIRGVCRDVDIPIDYKNLLGLDLDDG